MWDRWECEPHRQRCGTSGTGETSGTGGTGETGGTGGTGETSGTGETGETCGRASRKGVCKMFIFRLSFANCSLILRSSFA